MRISLGGILDRKLFPMLNKRFHGGEACRGKDESKGQGCRARCTAVSRDRAETFSQDPTGTLCLQNSGHAPPAAARLGYRAQFQNFTAV